jgi:predicted O-linked N-acetylglucosamine transferase (SPINDLY family)
MNLASALHAARRMTESQAAFEAALRLDPNHVETLNNHAMLLLELDQTSAAERLYRRAIELAPQRAELWNNLGNVLKIQGRLDEAIEHYRRTLQLLPGADGVHSNLLLTLNAHPRSDQGLLDDHRRWARMHGPASPAASGRFANTRQPDRTLRVGFVSSDFRRHAAASFFQSIIAAPRESWEAIGYSNVTRPDAITEQLRRSADGWRDIAGISDDRAAQMIHDDRIDILVDLSGHTAGNRLRLFARRAAPIQVTYLGYPNTTGLATMDYRITDVWADPPGMTEAHHTEALLRLAGGFLCYTPPHPSPSPREMRGNAPITFGTFNNFAKVTPAMVSLWARLLHAVSGSRLLIKAESLTDPTVQASLHATFAGHGIAPDRLVLLGREPSFVKHLEAYHRIDIALDTFPYHGTTTTCEALWMGVPVVTLAGRAHVSRVGVSLLNQIGRPEWIAADESAYVEVALRLARESAAHHEVCGMRLRERMAESPLMDRRRFGAAFSAAMRGIWSRWCAEQ